MFTIQSVFKQRWLVPIAIGALVGGTAVAEVPSPSDSSAWVGQNAMIYVNQASNHAIHSYSNPENMEMPAVSPKIVYVNQGYGQAIFSYPRQGPDATVAFNVEYVSPAYGQAIYSYPRNHGPRGWLKLMPEVSWLEDSGN
ncbi:MAG: hypothetical protein ACPW60_07580 [Methylohalobius sp. ZOD2]